MTSPIHTSSIQWLRLHEIPSPEDYGNTRRSGGSDSSPRLPRRGGSPLPDRIRPLAQGVLESPLKIESRARVVREATFFDLQGSFTVPVGHNIGIKIHFDGGNSSPKPKSGSPSPRPRHHSSVESTQASPVRRAPSSEDSAPHATIERDLQLPDTIDLFF